MDIQVEHTPGSNPPFANYESGIPLKKPLSKRLLGVCSISVSNDSKIAKLDEGPINEYGFLCRKIHGWKANARGCVETTLENLLLARNLS